MNAKRRLLFGVLTIIFVFLFSTFCMAADTPKFGGTLTIGLNDSIRTFSGATTHIGSLVASGPVFDSLLIYDQDLNPHPWLAKTWSISEDGLTYTFHLVRNATWHDGKPFTSADVKFTIEKILKKYHPSGPITWGGLKPIETPDKYTVVFKLKKPSAMFMKVLGPYHARIMPKHIYEGTDIMKNPANMHPIGTGPFRFVEWKRGSYSLLERNDNYWKPGLPYLDKIICKIIVNDSTRVAALQNGDIDLIPVYTPVNQLSRLKKDPRFVVTPAGNEGGKGVCMFKLNLQKKPLSDLKVRQAISHGLNKDQIHKLAGYSFGQRADGPFPRGIADWYNENQTTYAYDMKKANRLLDEAGYPRDYKGVRFKLDMELVAGHQTHNSNSEVAREQLKKIGIDLVLHMRDIGSHIDVVYKKWDFDATIAGHGMQFDPTIGFARYLTTKQIGHIPFTNCGGYSNARVDELFEKAAMELVPDVRTKMFHEIQEIVAKDIANIYLYEFPRPTAYNKDFVGFPMGSSSWSENYVSIWRKHGRSK